MSVINKLASSLGKRDETPNQELAIAIAGNNDKKAVKELVDNLSNKNKEIQSDCIKVLYEIGTLKPALIAAHVNSFIELLGNKNNRLQWGAMTALHTITNEKPEAVYNALPTIIAVADKGSVITNDHCVGILIKLAAMKKYAEDAFQLLLERLKICPTNQLPMYAENALSVINDNNKAVFIKTLTARLSEIEKETKRTRVEKVIKKLQRK
jgi:HEAT repeat protein